MKTMHDFLPTWCSPHRLLLLLLLPATLAGCAGATNGPGSPFADAPSADEYAAMPTDQRDAAAAAVQQTAAARENWWNDIGREIFEAGEPVQIGSEATGYTMLWAKPMGMTYIYPGHTNGGMGMEQNAIMAIATDEHGNFIREQTRGGGVRPVVVMANVATQEGLGRFLARGAFQVTGAAVNGAVAAQIRANNTCSENCGSPIFNRVEAASQSASEATGTGTASAASGDCATCGALRP